jgi:hypothetical protein
MDEAVILIVVPIVLWAEDINSRADPPHKGIVRTCQGVTVKTTERDPLRVPVIVAVLVGVMT